MNHLRNSVFCLSLAAAVLTGPTPMARPVECPNPDHSCCTSGSPGCSDEACCETVCAADPHCCEIQWDSLCVLLSEQLCQDSCLPACPNLRHDCCTTGSAGCADSECCEAVCAIEPFC